MSVSCSVSFPNEVFKQLIDRAISPTKAAQLGAEVALKGGIDALKNTQTLEDALDVKSMKIEQLELRIKNFKEEIAFLRPKAVKAIQEEEEKKVDAVLEAHKGV